ncbi:MAG: SDR family oxidoreductase [Flavobacteriales bacterium]|nr:SDR family oxidoreductase [Flavobacteriales bacterium]
MEKGYALVTGASQGFGRAIALQLAERGHGIIAVARTRSKLNEMADACGALNGGRVRIIESDLTAPDASSKLADDVIASGEQLDILVNNAGEAIWGLFAAKPLNDHLRMMKLNMTVPVELTHLLIPHLKRSKRAYILNVGSMAGYNAMATLSTYSGSKSFILRWSRSLRMELEGTGIRVCCVCPGSIVTGFTERAGMQALDELAKKFGHPPEPVAKAAVSAMFSGKAEVVPGLMNSITVFAMGLMPEALVERIASGIYLKKLK